MLNPFSRKKNAAQAANRNGTVTVSPDASPFAVGGRGPMVKSGKFRTADEQALYATGPSFVDFLPWAEYLPEQRALLLEDGRSLGAVFEITPLGTEGRPESRLEQVRDIVENALQQSFREEDTHQWVVQFFCQDESDMESYLARLRDYVRPRARGTPFSEAWLKENDRHIRGIAVPQGLFKDKQVTGEPWRGQLRRTRMVVYRYVNPKSRDLFSPAVELEHVCESLTAALRGAGVELTRQNGEQIHAWLLHWFNPAPTWIDKETLYRTARHCDTRPGDLPVINDFSETLLFNPPRSDVENGVWWFDDLPHKAIPVERLREVPNIGHLTGETRKGNNLNALMDSMPEGVTVSLTIVVQPQDVLEEQFTALGRNAVGENIESARVVQDVQIAKEYLGDRHKIYRAALVFYLRGNDLADLNRRTINLTMLMMNNCLQAVRPEYDVAPLNGYLRGLPMCFNPDEDKKHWYTRLTFVQHLANLAPVLGRDTGTGNPGFSFFNRGGSPLTFDPLNKADRKQNGHLLIFGPTGAGKSATLNALFAQVMAVHRPRLFIAEAGNSFGLFADYCATLGLTVNRISIKPGSKVSLASFTYAHQMLEHFTTADLDEDNLDAIDAEEEVVDGDEEQRDYMGEMEIAAMLMITGGEADEKLSRADRGMIRRAILMAAKATRDANKQMLPEDLQAALYEIGRDESMPEPRRTRAQEMGEALGIFTQGFEGQVFNRPGNTWPEADVTLIDLAKFAGEGYEAQLAVACIGLINTINGIAERDQYSGRDIVFAIDEAHLITTNPLLSPYITKVVKMWRKLGAWLWLATQNLKDFPNIAEKMLNMAEWWLCLTMPPDEIENIARFKTLNGDQVKMLESATKLPGCYTEGVVLGKNLEAIFRAVPPSLYLALGMTENHEKAERRALMKESGISELEAAFKVAEQLDIERGLPARENT